MRNIHIILLLVCFLESAVAAFDNVPASFEIRGESGVPAMHGALLANGKLAFLDKVEDRNKVFLSNGSAAYCCTYDPVTNDIKPLSAVTNPFCCAGAFLSDGRLVTLGGNGPLGMDPNVFDGFDAIRYLDAEGTQDGWNEPGNKLSSKRWYATAQVMADGKSLV
jgi:Glyoxal oxidase N-terminus